jgi:hypothetical protein
MYDGEDVSWELVDAVDEYAVLYSVYADDVCVVVVDDFVANPGAGVIDLYLFTDCNINVIVFWIDYGNLFWKLYDWVLLVGVWSVDCSFIWDYLLPTHCLHNAPALILDLLSNHDLLLVANIRNRLDVRLTRC